MTNRVKLIIDDQQVQAHEGTKILKAALDADIYIPNLCYIPEAELPFGGCRLCYVEVEGRGPVTACTLPVSDGMVVQTQTEAVIRLRKTAYKLLIAYHDLECRGCWKNKKCDLQKMAAKVKVKLKTPPDYRGLAEDRLPLDTTNPYFVYDPNRCILCGKCVWVCKNKTGQAMLDFANRGRETRICPSSDRSLMEANCAACAECAAVCPTAALQWQSDDEPSEAGVAGA